jgi:hypothetical protein
MNKTEFEEYLVNVGLKGNTIKNHLRNVDKFEKLNFYDLNLTEENIIKILKDDEISNSQRLTLASTMSKYLQFSLLPNKKLVEYIKTINNELNKQYKERNKKKEYQYSKKDILKEINRFYKEGNYRAYIVSYLVYYYNIRNMDVNVNICRKKKYAVSEHDNYLILRKNSVLYLRQKYKTSRTYGSKTHVVKARKFLESVRYMLRDPDINCIRLFDGFTNSTNILKNYLPFGLRTGEIIKIILAEDNSLHKASKIGLRRGTSLATLEKSYNLIV